MQQQGSSIYGLFLVAVMLSAYFIPTIIAIARHHHQRLAIFVLNMMLGWTVLGWIAALVWSATAVRQQDDDHAYRARLR